MSTTTSESWRSSVRAKKSQREGWFNWFFLVPAAFFFLGYMVFPILRVLYLSFTNYKFLSLEPAQFVGFNNYINALKDPLVTTGLWRAIEFTIMFLPGTIFLPLFLAVLVDRVKNERIATFYRIILLIPAVIPGPLVFVLWAWMYNFQIGPINYVLVEVLGLYTAQTAPQWMGGTNLSLIAVVIMEVWWGLGLSHHLLSGRAGVNSQRAIRSCPHRWCQRMAHLLERNHSSLAPKFWQCWSFCALAQPWQ